MKEIAIIKFGGSVITDKSSEEVINYDILKLLFMQLKKYGGKFVLVHGAGSFGHPIAKKYRLIEGSRNPNLEQILAVSRTHQKVQFLNTELIRIGQEFGLPLFPLHPSSFVIEENVGEYNFERSIVSEIIGGGFIPVIYGDMILSQSRSYTVLSGDVSMHKICGILEKAGYSISKVVYVSDVDGMYTDDPKKNPEAEMLTDVPYPEFHAVLTKASGSSNTDVTKGMFGKLKEIEEFLIRGIDVTILSATEERLYNCLTNGKYIGTVFHSSM